MILISQGVSPSYREQVARVCSLFGLEIHPCVRYIMVSYEYEYNITLEQYLGEVQYCEVGEVQYCEEKTDHSTTFPLSTPGSREAQTRGSLKLVWVKIFVTLA